MAQKELAGSGAGTASGRGDVGAGVAIGGAGVGVASGGGLIARIRDLIGAGTGQGTAVGDGLVSSVRDLLGSGTASASGGGALARRTGTSGSGVGTATGVGSLTSSVLLSGSGQAEALGDGTPVVNVVLEGSGTGQALGDGAPGVNVLLGGSGTARALGDGLATRLRSIEGSAVASSSGRGLIDRIRSLFGEGVGAALGDGSVEEAQIQRRSVALDVDSAHVDSDLSGFPVYVDLRDLPDTLLGSFAPDGSDLLTRDESGNMLPRELQNLDTVYSGPFAFNSSSAFGVKSNYSYSDSRSIGIENSGTAPNLGAEVFPSELSGGRQIDSLTFYYRETGDSTGGGLRFIDSSGAVILAAYTDNPEWDVYDADGTTEVDGGPSASDYGRWIEVEVVFDWAAGTAEVTWTDPNNTSDTASYTATLRSLTDVEGLTLNNYSSGDQNYTGNWVMWFDDISFTVDGETTLYDFETRRKIVSGDLYFRAPSLSSSSDTRFLIEKGDAPFSGNPENVWTNGEKAVWHLDSLDPSTDSTSGGNDATDAGNSQLTGGQIGQAVDLDSDDYLEVGNIGVPDLIAIEAWINPDDETSSFNMVAGNRRDVDNQDGWNFGVTYPNFEFKADDGSTYGVGFSSTVPQDQWSHVVALYDGDRAKVFLNGQLDNEADVYNGTLKNNANDPLVLGAMGHEPDQYGLDGQLDEIRVYDTPPSAAYISAQYVNQGSPTTFYTVNDVFVPFGGTGGARSEGTGTLRRTTETGGRGVATSESDSFLSRKSKVAGGGQGTATGSGVVSRPILFGGSGVARGLAEGNLEYSVIFEGTGAAEALGEGIFDYNVIIDGSGEGVATGDGHLSRITPFSGAGAGRAIGTGALGDIVAHWLTVDGATESTDAGSSASLSALDANKVHVFQVQALDSAYNFSGPTTLRVSPISVSKDQAGTNTLTISVETPGPDLHEEIELYRATSQGGPYTKIHTFTDPQLSQSYTDSGLSAGEGYYYEARGVTAVSGVDVRSEKRSFSTAYLANIEVGPQESSINGYPLYLPLSEMPSDFWAAWGSGKRIEVYENAGSRVPVDRVFVDPGSQEGEVYLKSDLNSTRNTDLFLQVVGGSEPAPTDTFGRNAVWDRFEAVWLMREDPSSSSGAFDVTGNGREARFDGSMDSSDLIDGPIGKAYDLDGSDDQLAVQNFPLNDEYSELTAQVWFRATSTGILLSWDRNEYFRMEIAGSQNNGNFGTSFQTAGGNTVDNLNASSQFTDGNWHRGTFVYDNGTAKLFVDGSREDKQSEGSRLGSTTERHGLFATNSEESSDGSSDRSPDYGGDIGASRVALTALSGAEVKAGYENQVAPSGFLSVRTGGRWNGTYHSKDVTSATVEVRYRSYSKADRIELETAGSQNGSYSLLTTFDDPSLLNRYDYTGLSGRTSYWFRATAYDADGNVISSSDKFSVTTESAVEGVLNLTDYSAGDTVVSEGRIGISGTNPKVANDADHIGGKVYKSDNQYNHNSKSGVTWSLNPSTQKTLEFDWEVSSEGSYDYLEVYVDGNRQLYKSGDQNGRFSTTLSAGSHTIEIFYSKDGSVSNRQDTARWGNVTYS